MSWGNELYRQMQVFGNIRAGAGVAVGIIVGIAIGYMLFGGGT